METLASTGPIRLRLDLLGRDAEWTATLATLHTLADDELVHLAWTNLTITAPAPVARAIIADALDHGA